MSWKSIVWAGCLMPVLTGCGALRHAASHVTGTPARSETVQGARPDVRTVWQTVRERNPGRTLTDEFRDGFFDGYAAYHERGTTRSTALETGRDYDLGFQYAAQVAATIERPPIDTSVGAAEPVRRAPAAPAVPYTPRSITAPAPSADTRAGKFDAAPSMSADRRPHTVAPLPKPELPVIKPFDPPLPDGTSVKFSPQLSLPNPELLPVPSPPLPVVTPSVSAL
ncbi:MAG TPA: hypothetical protein VGE74_29065, partial [Gemmata sp.]